jgi:small subunit ribosomal protein S7
MVFQVPVPLSEKARTITAVKWLVKVCRNKKGRDFPSVLATEILAAYKREGTAYGKKLELHKVAEANRAYSNLRRR